MKTNIPANDHKDKEAYLGHRDFLVNNYSQCMMVNLTDKKLNSMELKLGTRFQDLTKKFPTSSIGFTWFDYYNKTKGMN